MVCPLIAKSSCDIDLSTCCVRACLSWGRLQDFAATPSYEEGLEEGLADVEVASYQELEQTRAIHVQPIEGLQVQVTVPFKSLDQEDEGIPQASRFSLQHLCVLIAVSFLPRLAQCVRSSLVGELCYKIHGTLCMGLTVCVFVCLSVCLVPRSPSLCKRHDSFQAIVGQRKSRTVFRSSTFSLYFLLAVLCSDSKACFSQPQSIKSPPLR